MKGIDYFLWECFLNLEAHRCASQGICSANVRENREMSGNFKLKVPWDPSFIW